MSNALALKDLSSSPRLVDVSGIQARLLKSMKGCGRVDSLVYSVLSMVANQSYEHAAREIETFIEIKSEYPEFVSFAERYAEHCRKLIGMIKETREMPGFESLSMAKRQVISDQVLGYFETLKVSLKKIEQVEYNQRMTDLRSTLIFVKTFSWCVLCIIVLAFCLEFYQGLYSTTGAVADGMITDAVNWVFDKTGL